MREARNHSELETDRIENSKAQAEIKSHVCNMHHNEAEAKYNMKVVRPS
jgi:hypothetical protein